MAKNKFINKKPFFIAEISGNHNGIISNAKKLIDAAKSGGADAVKLQTYTPDMMTIKNKKKIKHGLWKNYNLWELYNKAQTPLSWHKELFDYAKKKKIKIFSSPFSEEAVDFLEKLKCQIYKVSSFEMNDLNLVKKIASTKKPMIISTGLASLEEIDETLRIAKKYGCKDITLLYCVSNYPSNIDDFSLNNLEIIKKKFKVKIGLSDHTIGSFLSCMSIIKGAEVIEKHICLKNIKSVDSRFSLNENEIANFKKDLDNSYKLIKNNTYLRSKSEMKNKIFRRSIYAISDINPGEKFTKKNIKTFRPDKGLSASFFLKIINKKSPIKISKGKLLNKNILSKIK